MEKRAKTQKTKRVEFTCELGDIISLSNNEVKKPSGWVTERIEGHTARITINGTTYEGTHYTKQEGGQRSEVYNFFDKPFTTDREVAEYIINKIEK